MNNLPGVYFQATNSVTRKFFRYLASGCTFTDLHYNYRIGISTAAKIVEDVCTAIWSIMRRECIPTPTVETWESIASDFERVANFPHCLGAVDGKHVRLTFPFNNGSMYLNYKDYFSVVLMAVADSNYRFVYVVYVGSFGKECDPTIFKRPSLWMSIEDGTQILPEERILPGTESPKVPFFFIGDAAFGLHKNLLRPYARTHTSRYQRKYSTIDYAGLEDMLDVPLEFFQINGIFSIVLLTSSLTLLLKLSMLA